MLSLPLDLFGGQCPTYRYNVIWLRRHWVIRAKARHQVIMSLKKNVTHTSKAMIR